MQQPMTQHSSPFLYQICLFLTAVVALLSGCATSPSVFTDHDDQQQFDDYRKFSWLTEQPAIVAGDLPVSDKIKSRFTKAIKSNLEAKGFVYTPKIEEAHFLVSYTLGARTNINVLQRSSSVYDNKENWLWGKSYYPHILSTSGDDEAVTYTKGVFAIDVYDVSKKAPVWHARASKQVRESDLKSEGGDVGAAVSKLLENFPPQ